MFLTFHFKYSCLCSLYHLVITLVITLTLLCSFIALFAWSKGLIVTQDLFHCYCLGQQDSQETKYLSRFLCYSLFCYCPTALLTSSRLGTSVSDIHCFFFLKQCTPYESFSYAHLYNFIYEYFCGWKKWVTVYRVYVRMCMYIDVLIFMNSSIQWVFDLVFRWCNQAYPPSVVPDICRPSHGKWFFSHNECKFVCICIFVESITSCKAMHIISNIQKLLSTGVKEKHYILITTFTIVWLFSFFQEIR